MHKNSLRIGHLNVYHLYNKVPDLWSFLNVSQPYYHFYGITETWLNDSISDSSLDIPNYKLVRRDPQITGETGIAVYVHASVSGITHRRSEFEPANLECIWLEFKPHSKAPSLFICCLYRHPAATLEWYDSFVNMLDKVFNYKHNADVLILGDFNIDMLKPHTCWDTTATLFGLTQLIQSPTRITPSSSTLIDHIYTKNPSAISSTEVGDLGISDHYPISCTKAIKLPKLLKNKHTTITFRSFKNFNSDTFLYDLSCTPFYGILLHSDPNLALDIWYSYFLAVLDKHAPVRRKRVKQPTLPPWLTQTIIQTMAERDKMKKSKNFAEFKYLRNKVKSLVRAAKKDYFKMLLENQKEVASVWRAMNSFTQKKRRQATNVTNVASADTFNEYFLSIAEQLLNHNDTSHISQPNLELLDDFCKQKNVDTDLFLIPLMTIDEVQKYISKLNTKKSSGIDGINNHILKLAAPFIVESLTHIFNLCIKCNVFPTNLKSAKVIPLPKVKDPKTPNDFRPISLLSVLSKILENHINKYLTEYLEKRNMFHPFQSGYRKYHSCNTALARLTNTWHTAVNQHHLSGEVFLDLSKAFDLINHDLLLRKLDLYLNHSKALSIFDSYLKLRKQQVLVDGSYSSPGLVKQGVPQGSVLGPVLFCIYINDLPLKLQPLDMEMHMLADDTTLHSSNSDLLKVQQTLQYGLNHISNWCHENSMLINPSKTKSMVITTRQKHQLHNLALHFVVNNFRIEQVDKHNLLGIIVDDKLQWQAHTENVCKTVSKTLFLLSKIQHLIDQDCRQLFYNAYIKPHIDYGSVVWDGCAEVHMKKLTATNN